MPLLTQNLLPQPMKTQGSFYTSKRKVGKESELEKLHYTDADCSESPRVKRTHWITTAEDRVA